MCFTGKTFSFFFRSFIEGFFYDFLYTGCSESHCALAYLFGNRFIREFFSKPLSHYICVSITLSCSKSDTRSSVVKTILGSKSETNKKNYEKVRNDFLIILIDEIVWLCFQAKG